MLGEIPFEEQRVIDELVEFWQNRSQPPDLAAHIYNLSGVWGNDRGADFIRSVYVNVRTGKNRYKYAFAFEFKQFLVSVYYKQAIDQMVKERWEEEKREEKMRENKRKAGWANSSYVNHCWACGDSISSETNDQCPNCKYYKCGNCGVCLCGSRGL